MHLAGGNVHPSVARLVTASHCLIPISHEMPCYILLLISQARKFPSTKMEALDDLLSSTMSLKHCLEHLQMVLPGLISFFSFVTDGTTDLLLEFT